jgi:L,D-transpeptidase ErfK/SrfK
LTFYLIFVKFIRIVLHKQFHNPRRRISMEKALWWTILAILVLLLMLFQPASAQLEQNTSTSWGSTASPIPASAQLEQSTSTSWGDTATSVPALEQSQSSEDNISILEQFGTALCGDTVNFYCLEVGETVLQPEVKTGNTVTTKVKRGIPKWEELWGDTAEREIVMKINRTNLRPYKSQKLAVPCNMSGKTFMDYSPYPLKIEPPGEKLLIWDPALLAWGAYDPDGYLVRWGPGVGGKDRCDDVDRANKNCHTRVGEFRVILKDDKHKSGRYPRSTNGGAPMPFAVFFAPGYAFHAGNLPGANASHGCVRVFYSDAKWLYEWLGIGTKVIVRPYPVKMKK